METINLIRLIFGCTLIGVGLIVFIIEIRGVFKLKYTLNRMHFAGTGDTFGFACIILGAVIINGADFASLKLILVLVFFWFASPVSSHLISRVILNTDERVSEHCRVCNEDESAMLIRGEEK